MGNANGAITLYEFSDYNCGYCKRVFEPIQQLLRDNLMSVGDQGAHFKPIVTGCRPALNTGDLMNITSVMTTGVRLLMRLYMAAQAV